jgi:transcriptional regulator GlxA family with amidase domain
VPDASAEPPGFWRRRSHAMQSLAVMWPSRYHGACAFLQDRRLSIGDVAFFLQYSEPAAFNRSFRRWTGRIRREFR